MLCIYQNKNGYGTYFEDVIIIMFVSLFASASSLLQILGIYRSVGVKNSNILEKKINKEKLEST